MIFLNDGEFADKQDHSDLSAEASTLLFRSNKCLSNALLIYSTIARRASLSSAKHMAFYQGSDFEKKAALHAWSVAYGGVALLRGFPRNLADRYMKARWASTSKNSSKLVLGATPR
jgi:hypothetical protein